MIYACLNGQEQGELLFKLSIFIVISLRVKLTLC